MLKPSIKSVEGVTLIGLVSLCGLFVHELITGVKIQVPTDELLKQAKTVSDIVAVYNAGPPITDYLARYGTVGGILTFLYKVYTDFTAWRSRLKAQEMQTKIERIQEIPAEDVHPVVESKRKPIPPEAVGVIVLCFLLAGSLPSYAATAKFSWLPNSEPDLAGYKVKWGESSGNYTHEYDCHKPGTQSDGRVYCTVDGVPETLSYFACFAYDAAGGESDASNELSVDIVPSAPQNFTIIFPAGAVMTVQNPNQ